MKETRPDFARFEAAISRKRLPDRLPIAENDIDFGIMQSFIGKPISDIKSYVQFWQQAGYDFVGCEIRGQFIADSFQKKIAEGLLTMDKAAASVSTYESATISDFESFHTYPWTDLNDVYYKDLDEIEQYLPERMKIVIFHGPIFSGVMRIMGLEAMSIAAFEKPDLLRAIADTMGNFSVKVIENLAQRDSVGAIWLGDDIAYSGGPFVSPAFLREYIFPFYKKIGDICQRYDKLFVYHSDGKLFPILDDLLACGIQAVHPNECQSVDIAEFKRSQGQRISLIGNVDVDLLSRGQPEEIVAATKYLIENVAPGGGFVLGSGNSIPDYVPLENYKAMLSAVQELGAIY